RAGVGPCSRIVSGARGRVARRTAGPPSAAARRTKAGGPMVLPRSLWSARLRDGQADGYRTASSHRSSDRDLVDRGRGTAPGQPGPRAIDPAGPAQSHDGRLRDLAFRGDAGAQFGPAARGAALDRAPGCAPSPAAELRSLCGAAGGRVRRRARHGADGRARRSPFARARPFENGGADIVAGADGEADVPLDPSFEHALVLIDGQGQLGDVTLERSTLYYLGAGRDAAGLTARAGSRLMLFGGR